MPKQEIPHPDRAASTGPYSDGVILDGWLHISGQGPLDQKTDAMISSSIEEGTRLTMLHIGPPEVDLWPSPTAFAVRVSVIEDLWQYPPIEPLGVSMPSIVASVGAISWIEQIRVNRTRAGRAEHRDFVVSDPIGTVPCLQLGRAFVAGGKTKAKHACQDFLNLWKDADPDIPILKEAQAEYSKLQWATHYGALAWISGCLGWMSALVTIPLAPRLGEAFSIANAATGRFRWWVAILGEPLGVVCPQGRAENSVRDPFGRSRW
jgi:hypothetical protein